MPRTSFARCVLSSVVLCLLFPVVRPAAQAQPDANSADARLRALYTEEWKWRQQEMARGDQPGEAGIRRVVFGLREPPTFVDGEGAEILAEAGVDVIELSPAPGYGN